VLEQRRRLSRPRSEAGECAVDAIKSRATCDVYIRCNMRRVRCNMRRIPCNTTGCGAHARSAFCSHDTTDAVAGTQG
jgi:hypothetical protein